MARLARSNPFKRETPWEKRRRLQLAARNSQGRAILDLLLEGSYWPPTIPDRPQQETSDDGGEWEDTNDQEGHSDKTSLDAGTPYLGMLPLLSTSPNGSF
ncbi:hypothetical protein PCASD_07154 [Puccinia coronata f. sp. avenae]|uniref:Uncharacterized protein n=1 Tax=Puccinia coronata f. sp. avenae TaxID=200324 RepID=A0A2N5V497_9BASI|nr:hypothetical protein PCASD_07154 [Puccinia coronata f. sp. avenae]